MARTSKQKLLGTLVVPPILADRRELRIGLLGGSFNPAHKGHLHVSEQALRLLGLDEVWWLVSPQNPLKPQAGMGPFDRRLSGAAKLAKDPRITVTGLEVLLGTRYSCDTIAELQRRFPRARFVWLIGADNLRQIHLWRRWESIFRAVPVAVFARPAYSVSALSSKAALKYRSHRVNLRAARRITEIPLPAWVFFPSRLDSASATALRRFSFFRRPITSRSKNAS